eukprot:4491418-Pyramimonas_sp.AAC.1
MRRANILVPTLATIDDAIQFDRSWFGELPEDNRNDADADNPPARLPVAWENNFRARPTRSSRSVSRRIGMCRDHRLIIPALRHAAGSAARAREQSQLDLDLKVISGPKAASITDGVFTLDRPEGRVYFHHDDPLIKIRLFGDEVRE